MRLTIENKTKLEIFVAIFQLLKNWSSHINMNFEKGKLSIQSMDKSHVCLANIEIKDKWFYNYECSNNTKISVDSSHFAILMNYVLKHDKLELKFDDQNEPDKLFINFLNDVKDQKDKNKGSFDHFFELNLIDVDEDSLGIPEVEYDVEFTIESKKLVELLSELNTFGTDLNIKCAEDLLEFNANGETTKLKVNIPVNDLDEYSICEGEELNISFSLSHLSKMCTSMKMSSVINVCLSREYPMALKYNLGDDSTVSFYIAPKITDN
jgi:proliferating cell nuclear antigen